MLFYFEGIDSSGKTSVMKQVADTLAYDLYDVTITEQPSKTLYGGRIRQLLLNEDLSKEAQMHLFLADRYEFNRKYKDIIESDEKILLCDRSLLSTLTYQSGEGHYSEVTKDKIIHLHKDILKMNKPVKLFAFKVSLDNILDRMDKRGKLNILDSDNEKVVASRLNSFDDSVDVIKKYWDVKTINANKSFEEVVQNVYNAIIDEIENKKVIEKYIDMDYINETIKNSKNELFNLGFPVNELRIIVKPTHIIVHYQDELLYSKDFELIECEDCIKQNTAKITYEIVDFTNMILIEG